MVDEKRVFVKPTLHPTLTDECEKATGIGPMALESAGTIENAVQEFNDYLYRSFTANNKEFCLMTCGEVSLKRWLRIDAKRKGVVLPAHFSSFVDLTTEFRKHYPKLPSPPPPPAPALPALASALDISLESHSTGGLLYCRGIAQVVTRILADGADISHATVHMIPSDYSPLTDPAWAVFRTATPAAALNGGAAGLAVAGAVGEGGAKAGEAGPGYVVKCRGLPYSASDKDIREFFSDCRVLPDGVLICLTHSGRPSGDAFVCLATPEDMQRAVKKDREKIDRRYVEARPLPQRPVRPAARVPPRVGPRPPSRPNGGGGGGGGAGQVFGSTLQDMEAARRRKRWPRPARRRPRSRSTTATRSSTTSGRGGPIMATAWAGPRTPPTQA